MSRKRKKESFIIHLDKLDILEKLTDEQVGRLFRAIRIFQLSICSDDIDDVQKAAWANELETLLQDQIVDLAFSTFKNQFEADHVKYQETCDARSKAVSTRYTKDNNVQVNTNATNVDNSKQVNTCATDTDTDTDTDTESIHSNVDDLQTLQAKSAPQQESLPSKKQQRESIDYNGVAKFWNEHVDVKRFGSVRSPFAEKRKRAVKKCFDQFGKRSFIEVIQALNTHEFFQYAEHIGFDWVFDEMHYNRILDGFYNNENRRK